MASGDITSNNIDFFRNGEPYGDLLVIFVAKVQRSYCDSGWPSDGLNRYLRALELSLDMGQVDVSAFPIVFEVDHS
jgi:hypothetical protein